MVNTLSYLTSTLNQICYHPNITFISILISEIRNYTNTQNLWTTICIYFTTHNHPLFTIIMNEVAF